LQDIRQMLKKNSGYMQSEQFRRVQSDVEQYLTTGHKSPET
jgi:hypothetical protein